MSELDFIGVMEGTDKSSSVSLAWDYLRHYEDLFQKWRYDAINLIEIGVLGGSSLRTWHRYFDKATIIGIDIKSECRRFAGDRVIIEIGSQEDPGFLGTVATKYPPTIVIDDGSHIAHQMIASFEVLFPMLLPGGMYVFEDLSIHFEDSEVQYLGARRHQGLAGMSIYDYLSRFVRARAANLSTPKDSWGVTRYAFEQIDSMTIFGGACVVRKRAISPNDLDRSVAMFESELKLEAARFDILEKYATYLVKHKKKLDRPIQLLRQEIAVNQENRSARSLLVDVLITADRLDEATDVVNELVGLDPEEPRWWRQAVQLERTRRDVDKELAALQKLLQIEPGSAWAYDGLGSIYERRGDISAALTAARTASKLAPSNNHFRNRVSSLEDRG